MKVKDNKLLINNLNDNMVANNNQILANNQVSIETRGAMDALFENILELICMPKEKFRQIKSGLIAKQIENCQKILLRAKDIKDKFGMDITPPPLKFSIPFMKQAACEHEEEMYDIWAKLLIEAANKYNPIQLQYADILSKISSNEAKLLKKIYKKQQDTVFLSNVWLVVNQLSMGYGKTVYYKGNKFNKENLIDILYPYSDKENISIILLEKLGIISKFFNQRLSSDRKLDEPGIGLYLTEFGYSMLDCLEKHKKESGK